MKYALHDSCWSWEWLGVLAGEVMDMVESAFYDHVGVVQKGWNMFQPPVSTESTAVHAAFCRVGVSISLAKYLNYKLTIEFINVTQGKKIKFISEMIYS